MTTRSGAMELIMTTVKEEMTKVETIRTLEIIISFIHSTVKSRRFGGGSSVEEQQCAGGCGPGACEGSEGPGGRSQCRVPPTCHGLQAIKWRG